MSMVQEIAKGVFWVGIVDWGLRHFHGHELSTPRGSSYNAYLVLDKHVALVDTVWTPFRDELVENIRKVVDPATIEYVVVNHSEPDHSGGLTAVLQHCPKATVVVSKAGSDSVPGHYHGVTNLKVVKSGDSIDLGSCQLKFVEAPMLHWPDTMFTFVTGRNILMSNDAFGQHYATAHRFDDQVDAAELEYEALRYYANILTPFSAAVARKIDELKGLNLPVEMIAPSHGVLWRKDPGKIVSLYRKWADQVPERSAVILYDSMWEATRTMATAVGEGLAQAGVPYKVFHLATADRNEAVTEVFKAKAVIVGSSTYNRGLLPSVMPILEEIRGLSLKNKVGAAFGSYGWSGESVKLLEDHLAACRIPVVAKGVKAKWQPRPEDLEACRGLGKQVAESIGA